jgi:hypothetical protein
MKGGCFIAAIGPKPIYADLLSILPVVKMLRGGLCRRVNAPTIGLEPRFHSED